MDAHPAIAAPGETYLFTACARFLHADTSVDGMKVGVLNGLSFAGFKSDDILARLRNFAFTIRREHAIGQGKKRWAEKTAVDAFHIEAIERLCGEEVYFVCVTRHGLDVALSMIDWCNKSQSYPSELHSYIQKYPSPLIAFCHAWKDATNAIHRFVKSHPENSISIRYEDMVENTDKVMRHVVEFIGEEWSSALVEKAMGESDPKGFSDWKTFSKNKIDRSNIGRWRELSPATLSELSDIINPTLLECGYDQINIDLKDSDRKARRRYEMGLALQKMKPNNSN